MEKVSKKMGNGNLLPRAAAKRVDSQTVDGIAHLCAKSLTESEACRLIGIAPKSWFSWKSRHSNSEQFAARLERFRSERIESLISRIEDSSNGVGIRQPDWRASQFLLAVADGRRFSAAATAATTTTNNNTLAIVGGEEGLRKLLDKVWAQPPEDVERSGATLARIESRNLIGCEPPAVD